MPRTNERSFNCGEVRQKYFKQNRGDDDSLVPTISQRQFQALMTKLDRLENKLEILISKVIEKVNNGNKPKDLPLNEFFSTFCALKAWDENHPSAKAYKSSLDWFFRFLTEKHQEVRSLRELTPVMISEYIKYHKGRHVYSKRRSQWEKLSERTINAHIKKLRHALEIVDKVGTQELREPLITIKRPHLKKNPYIPTDAELTKIPEMLKILRESVTEDARYLAFIVATVLQFCGRTNALSELRFDMIDGLNENEKPIVSYIGKHGVEQVKGITNGWYRDFLEKWRKHIREKYGTQYFFPRKRNGAINHITDEQLRTKFKEFMRICGLPKLTVHSFRYIYATKLYLKGVPPDAIKDILGVDKRTLKYYVKATQERKKKALFTHLEKVSALPKERPNRKQIGQATDAFPPYAAKRN
jgi:integrase